MHNLRGARHPASSREGDTLFAHYLSGRLTAPRRAYFLQRYWGLMHSIRREPGFIDSFCANLSGIGFLDVGCPYFTFHGSGLVEQSFLFVWICWRHSIVAQNGKNLALQK